MDNFNFLNKTLNISEIFYSIQGEGTRAGMPCVFVRLTGCNLRCKWCDTIYAQDINSGQKMSFNEILEKIYSYDCDFIEFTGGEPLMQEQVVELMNFLAQKKFTVAIETNGTFSTKELSHNIIKIIDIKCPSSNMEKYNLWENFQYITKNDELKFVIASEEDFVWSKEIIARYSLLEKTSNILFSAVNSCFSYEKLAKLILNSNCNYRMQLQLHKIIWGEDSVGV